MARRAMCRRPFPRRTPTAHISDAKSHYRKLNTASFPVIAIAMTSDVLRRDKFMTPPMPSYRSVCRRSPASVESTSTAVRCRRSGWNQSAFLVQVRYRLAGCPRGHFEFECHAPKGAIESDELHYQIYTNDNAGMPGRIAT